MTTLEKHIVKFIDNKYSFPYLHYNKLEQTWTNEFFLFDIKTGTMFISDDVKQELNKQFGKGYMDKVFLIVISSWFNKTYKIPVKEIV